MKNKYIYIYIYNKTRKVARNLNRTAETTERDKNVAGMRMRLIGREKSRRHSIRGLNVMRLILKM